MLLLKHFSCASVGNKKLVSVCVCVCVAQCSVINFGSNFPDSVFSPFQIHCCVTNTWSRGFSVVRAGDTNLLIENLTIKLTLST